MSAERVVKSDEQRARERAVHRWLATPPEVHQQNWANEYLDKLPRNWRRRAAEKFERLRRVDVQEAFGWLGNLVAPLSEKIDIAADDETIRDLADHVAAWCRGHLADASDLGRLWAGLSECHEECVRYGVMIPDAFDRNGQILRLTDSSWWLRNLRGSFARAREAAAINAGLVHAAGDVYCSDDTVDRRGQQLRRNAELLEKIELVSRESGKVISLKDAAAAGMASHVNRKNELMTRIRGMEEHGRKREHVCSFVTVTCPSRMHSMRKKEGGGTEANPKYDNTTPDRAQKYLAECWARVRAQWARDGVRVYGLRVAEPHHDGTPHWHLVLFHARNVDIRPALVEQFCKDSQEEIKRNQAARVKVIKINPKRGSAAGYVMKYVAKNLGGIDGDYSDEAEVPSIEAWQRVEAWASTWRIRQFQQIGGHFVSVWRELRRVDEGETLMVDDDGKTVPASRAIFDAWQAAQRRGENLASYADFMEAMGGVETSPHHGLVALAVDYETKQGKYGQTTTRFHRGVRERFGLVVAFGNREHWQRV